MPLRSARAVSWSGARKMASSWPHRPSIPHLTEARWLSLPPTPTEERTPVLFTSIYRTPLEGESQPSQQGVRNRVQSEGRDGATLCPGRRHLAGRRATCHLGPDAFVRRHRHRGSLGPVHRCHRRSRGQERRPSHPDRMDEISCHMLVPGTTRPPRSVRSRYAP